MLTLYNTLVFTFSVVWLSYDRVNSGAAVAAAAVDPDSSPKDDVGSNTKVFLTSTNYDGLTSNKTVLIKWAAPWCSHSQDLAPVWDLLVSTSMSFKNNQNGDETPSSLLLAEVDCGEQAQVEWCSNLGYTAFPTLTYGDPSMGGIFLETYQSLDKSYDTLVRFVQHELLSTSFCTPGNQQACPKEMKDKLETFWNMTSISLQLSIEKEEAELQRIQNKFAATNEDLKQKYSLMSREHHTGVAQINRHLKLLRGILRKVE
jgi:thiol-disulfide isomerase/thioredoxin